MNYDNIYSIGLAFFGPTTVTHTHRGEYAIAHTDTLHGTEHINIWLIITYVSEREQVTKSAPTQNRLSKFVL